MQDVARVELGAQDYFTNSYLNGKPAVALALYQRPNTNALQAAKEIIAKMERLKKDFPAGLEYRIVYNPTQFISNSIDAVFHTIGEAILLVVLVIILFLQSWRSAIIPIVAIPVSLIGTFAVMAAFGFSINNLTMFGMVLAIGIVVDDAIVVVENVERNVRKGLAPRDAAHETMDEVATALIAIALVLSAVFIPTALIPGLSGEFYRQFALTIAVSTMISAFLSLTLSPALAALLLRPHTADKPQFLLARLGRTLAGGINRGFERMSGGYANTVGIVTRRKAIMLPLYGLLLGATVWVTGHVQLGFIPTLDQGYGIIVAQLPDGSSLSRTDEVTRRISEIALKVPGVRDAVAFAGFSAATFTNATNSAAVFVPFKPFDERVKTGRDGNTIIKELNQRLHEIQEAFIIVISPPSGARHWNSRWI